MGLSTSEYSTEEVKIGEWNSNFSECQSKADSKNIPMIAYWTPGRGCSYCSKCENYVFCNDTFKSWRATTPYIWSYNETKDTDAQEAAYEAVKGGHLKEFPFVWLHWKTRYGLTIDLRFPGRNSNIPIQQVDTTSTKFEVLFPGKFMATIKYLFGAYVG